METHPGRGHGRPRDSTRHGLTVITYEQFRTGLTFGEVRRMLWIANPDRRTWRQKSRGVVLGFWRQLKLAMWNEFCNRNPDLVTE